jgi:hypothetical protein
MHIKYFGDSYDIVKQSLIRWLAPFGRWSVHPMFTETPGPMEATHFATFLGADLLSDTVLTAGTHRPAYFSCASMCGNFFLDPDTGLRLEPVRGKRAPEFLFVSELISLIQKSPRFLTLVFDQSHPRGSVRASLNKKLGYLSNHGISAFAYESHTCFIIAGQDSAITTRARAHLLAESRLPASRFALQLPSE